jgi:hypothetical protein
MTGKDPTPLSGVGTEDNRAGSAVREVKFKYDWERREAIYRSVIRADCWR